MNIQNSAKIKEKQKTKLDIEEKKINKFNIFLKTFTYR